jgi:alkylhydroperoxidase/carboxymuconolactone decarboxylase family protein YurZ
MTDAPPPSEPGRPDDRREQALAVRARILGESWDAGSRVTPGLEAFTELGIQHMWMGQWIDPVLELRLKSTVTISSLIALHHLPLLGFHVAGALRNSLLTPEELRGIALHLNPYVGYPTARDAMVVIDREIAAWESTAGPGAERG